MNLTEWAHAQGIPVTTAYRWYREGTLPVPARNVGLPVVRVEAEAGSGMNGARARARRLLADPAASLVVAGGSEVTGDLVRDMIEVLTSFCARRYGRRPVRNRALQAVGCAQRDIGPRAVLKARNTPCGGAG